MSLGDGGVRNKLMINDINRILYIFKEREKSGDEIDFAGSRRLSQSAQPY